MEFTLLLKNCVNGTWLLTNTFRNESMNSYLFSLHRGLESKQVDRTAKWFSKENAPLHPFLTIIPSSGLIYRLSTTWWKQASCMHRLPWLCPACWLSFAPLTPQLRLLPSCDVGWGFQTELQQSMREALGTSPHAPGHTGQSGIDRRHSPQIQQANRDESQVVFLGNISLPLPLNQRGHRGLN